MTWTKLTKSSAGSIGWGTQAWGSTGWGGVLVSAWTKISKAVVSWTKL